MSWLDWIPSIIEGIGLFQDRDNASRPEAPPPLDLEELVRLAMVNTQTPYGSMNYTQGDNGQYTGQYQFSDQVQPVFDRYVDRAMNPDQAYQLPDQLSGLYEALMNSRLQNAGGVPMGPRTTPQPERTQYTGPPSPFQAAEGVTPNPSAVPQASVSADPSQTTGGLYGYGSGYGLGTGGSYGTAAPMFGSSSSEQGFNDYLNQLIPGAEQGTQLEPWQEGALDNAGAIGNAIGLATGIPGLGMLGNAVADNWYMNNALQNPAENLPPSGNDMINQAVSESPYNMGNMGAQQSPVTNPYSFYGTLGSWYGFSNGSDPLQWVYGRIVNSE